MLMWYHWDIKILKYFSDSSSLFMWPVEEEDNEKHKSLSVSSTITQFLMYIKPILVKFDRFDIASLMGAVWEIQSSLY